MDELALAVGAAGEHAVFIGANPFLEVNTIAFPVCRRITLLCFVEVLIKLFGFNTYSKISNILKKTLQVPNPSKAVEYRKGYVMRKCCNDPDGRKSKLPKSLFCQIYWSICF